MTIIIVSNMGLVFALEKILEAQGHNGPEQVVSVDYVDPIPEPLTITKPNDFDRPYGKKYRRSLRK